MSKRSLACIAPLTDHLVDGHHVVLRSTVYPGVTKRVARLIAKLGRDIDVSFCPERIAEGHALARAAHPAADCLRDNTTRGAAGRCALPAL